MPRIPFRDKMVCPHCRVAFTNEWSLVDLGRDPGGSWQIRQTACAHCDRLIVMLRQDTRPPGIAPPATGPPALKTEWMIWPRAVVRAPLSENIPNSIANDYGAACRVLPESPEASAALSRRCLQNLLVEKARVKHRDLAPQIQEVIDSGVLPTQIAQDLDVVRIIGNFGTHPIKSQSTGQIVEVEPGEAEWNLDVLEALFDFFFAQAERRQQRRAALNEKLRDAGRKPLP